MHAYQVYRPQTRSPAQQRLRGRLPASEKHLQRSTSLWSLECQCAEFGFIARKGLVYSSS